MDFKSVVVQVDETSIHTREPANANELYTSDVILFLARIEAYIATTFVTLSENEEICAGTYERLTRGSGHGAWFWLMVHPSTS